jgi:hypothetical protein
MNAALTFTAMAAMLAAHILLMWEMRPGSKSNQDN